LAQAVLLALVVRLVRLVALEVLAAQQRLALCYLLVVVAAALVEQFRGRSLVVAAVAVQALRAQQEQLLAALAALQEFLLPQEWSVEQGLLVE
jgi:hypothetical protein